MRRIVPGLILAFCWMMLLLKGSLLLFGLVLLVVTFVGGFEYTRMALANESTLVSCIVSCLYTLPLVWLICIPQFPLGLSFLISFFLLSFYVLYRFQHLENSFEYSCRLLFGLVYIGFLFSHLLLLRALPEGGLWIILLTAITAGSDTGAYFIGKALGKHKLCPYVSPNKTIEGAAGGLVTAILFSWLFGLWLLPSVNSFFILFLAIPLTGAGIVGDLFESIIKRGTNTKDSGKILKGHGGILDRLDSLLFAGPILYYLLVLTGG